MGTKNLQHTAFKHIVFYDGECGFCNTSVQFILRYRKKELYFISLQSDTAKKWLQEFNVLPQLNTIYFLSDGMLYSHSSAILRIGRFLKHPYHSMAVIGKWLPKRFRDRLYVKIARNRHKILNRRCYLPTENERKYFIF